MSDEEEFGVVLLFGAAEVLPLVPVVLGCDPLLPIEPVAPEDVELFTSAEFDRLMSVEEEAFGVVEELLFGGVLEVLVFGDVEVLPLVPVVLGCDPLLPTEPVAPEDVELFASAEFDWLMSVEEEAFGTVEELLLFGEVPEVPEVLVFGDVEVLPLVPVVLDCGPEVAEGVFGSSAGMPLVD